MPILLFLVLPLESVLPIVALVTDFLNILQKFRQMCTLELLSELKLFVVVALAVTVGVTVTVVYNFLDLTCVADILLNMTYDRYVMQHKNAITQATFAIRYALSNRHCHCHCHGYCVGATVPYMYSLMQDF